MSSSPKEFSKEPLDLAATSSLEHSKEHDGAVIHASPPAKITKRCLALMFTICMGGFLFGYDIGVISGCLIMKDFGESTLRPGVIRQSSASTNNDLP